MVTQENRNKVIAAIVVGVLVLGLAGKWLMRSAADRAIESAIESRTGGNVDVNTRGGTTTYTDAQGNTVTVDGATDGDGTVTYQGADGSTGSFSGSAGGDAKLPDGFPSDFPAPSGAVLVSSYGGVEGSSGNKGFSVVWNVSDSVSESAAFYKKQLAAEGWTVVSTTDMGAQTMIAFERRGANSTDKDGGLVAIAEQDGKTTVTVSLGIHASN